MSKRDIAKQAVEAIIYDLTDRHGLSDEWDQIDGGIQTEIKNKWREIIERALDSYKANIV